MGTGLLVVLEGIDGSGKSTLARGLCRSIREGGREVVSTREPTDGPIGRRIRALASSGRESVSPEEEFELFHEDRKTHVDLVVRPALARGSVVVQDRSYFSTVAYQGQRGLDREELLRKSRAIAPEPDILLIVDLPVDVALKRIRKGRDQGADGFETRATLESVRRQFLAFPGATVLDGAQTPEDVLRCALGIVRERL